MKSVFEKTINENLVTELSISIAAKFALKLEPEFVRTHDHYSGLCFSEALSMGAIFFRS